MVTKHAEHEIWHILQILIGGIIVLGLYMNNEHYKKEFDARHRFFIGIDGL